MLTAELKKIVIDHRQNLHQIPEIGDALYETKKYVLEVLSELNCEIIPIMNTGILAYFHMGQAQTIAFRADMDGLSIQEENSCSYKSTNSGNMHACGHDAHMAMVLTLAKYIDTIKNHPSNIMLIFQPAEESSGGGEKISNSGCFEKYNIIKVFGIHMLPSLPQGQISSKPNHLMSMSAELDIKIEGKSAHAATAQKGIDSLFIACQYISQIYEMYQNEIIGGIAGTAPHDCLREDQQELLTRTLLKICKFSSGTARNIISGHTSLLGTMRAFDEKIFNYMRKRLNEIAGDFEKKYGCKISVSNTKPYPPVTNDPLLYAEIKPVLDSVDYVELSEPLMISEDFSFYGKKAPSVFFFLGTGKEVSLHNNRFELCEETLWAGVELYQRLIEKL